MDSAQVSNHIQDSLNQLISRFDGLQAILVSTSDGVPLIKAEKDHKNENVSTEYVQTIFPPIFAAAAEQAGKLRFGAVKTVTSFFESAVLLHINHMPLVVTFIADATASIGALHSLTSQLKPALDALKSVVESTEVTA